MEVQAPCPTPWITNVGAPLPPQPKSPKTGALGGAPAPPGALPVTISSVATVPGDPWAAAGALWWRPPPGPRGPWGSTTGRSLTGHWATLHRPLP